MLIGIDASRAFVKDKTGTENYSYELIREILKLPEARKHTFRLYVRGGVGQIKEFVERVREGSGFEAKASKTDPGLETVEINWKRLWTQGGLALELWRRPVDVLWVPAHTLPVVRRGKMKTVVTIHGLEYEYLPEFYDWRKKWFLNKSTEYAVRFADKIIAVSEWTKSQLVDRLQADSDKIEVVHEGIGKRFVANRGKLSKKHERFVRQKYGLHKNYILFLGTIQPRKNLVRLIEAFSMMTSESSELALRDRSDASSELEVRNSASIQLVIAGKEGWMAEEIYEAPKKYGVEDKVKFIGRVAETDLPAVYQMADLFVWPSLMEGFGLPVLEAMQMGVPVVTSDRGALPEVTGEAGLQIDPENVRELAEAIELVLNSQELRDGLVEKGYKQVKKFSWYKAAKETLAVLSAN